MLQGCLLRTGQSVWSPCERRFCSWNDYNCSGCELRFRPQGHARLLRGKNLFLYSPIGAWFRIAPVALAQSDTEDPIWLSQPPPLMYDSWIRFFLLIRSCKNWWPLLWPWLKVVIHWSVHALLDLSLRASNEVNWAGVQGTIVLLAWSSTIAWRCHLALLGQSQKSCVTICISSPCTCYCTWE